MKKVDIHTIQGVAKEDNNAIIEHYKKQIDMYIDENGRIYNEGGQYIADGEVVEDGFGIGCSNWGGRRPGAGRKSTGRRKRLFYITDEEYDKIQEFINELRNKKEVGQ